MRNQHKMLGSAFALAATKFRSQVDRGGRAYFGHGIRVMLNLPHNADIETRQVAVMHDLIEDTGITKECLQKEGFCERVVDGVVAISKVKGETEDEYYARIKTNEDAIYCKIADLEDNMDLTRLKSIHDKDILRCQNYHKRYVELIKVSGYSVYVKAWKILTSYMSRPAGY